jgi:hypothetical protein
LIDGLAGWLNVGFLKVWQPRYFKLFSDGLQYFKDKKAVEPQGTVPIFAISAVEIPAGKSKEGDRFDVSVGDTKKDKKSGGGRIFSLRADNAAECAKWVELLQKLLSDAAADARRAGGRANQTTKGTSGAAGGDKFWKDQSKLADMKLKQSTQKVEVKSGVVYDPTPILAPFFPSFLSSFFACLNQQTSRSWISSMISWEMIGIMRNHWKSNLILNC